MALVIMNLRCQLSGLFVVIKSKMIMISSTGHVTIIRIVLTITESSLKVSRLLIWLRFNLKTLGFFGRISVLIFYNSLMEPA